MLTYEDLTEWFLKSAANLGLIAHPEYWVNSRSLEREFACTCHTGNCEGVENRSACTVSFSWSTLDTALSLEGPAGVCNFFHEPENDCPHLHTHGIPPLTIDLSYTLTLNGAGASISEGVLLSLMQMLKLQASEHSSRAVETRPGISMMLHENRLQPETLTLQQRVELPIWHPDGMRSLQDEQPYAASEGVDWQSRRELDDEDHEEGEVVADNPRPEDWVPLVMVEVCQDILQGLEALETVRTRGSLNRRDQ